MNEDNNVGTGYLAALGMNLIIIGLIVLFSNC